MVEHTIEARKAQVRLLLGTLMYPSLPPLTLKFGITIKQIVKLDRKVG